MKTSDIPAAKTKDPLPSYIAEEKITLSGARDRQIDLVLSCIRRSSGKTSKELALIFELDRHMVARRLADLKNRDKAFQGHIRECGVSGIKSVTWWPI